MAITSVSSDSAAATVGTRSATPAETIVMPVNTGLRTHRNRPVSTKAVRSASSTPMRQDVPIADCAARVTTSPPTVSAVPAPTAMEWAKASGPRSAPITARTTASRPSSSATTNSTPPHQEREPGRPETPLKPDEPVLIRCAIVRAPKAARSPAT